MVDVNSVRAALAEREYGRRKLLPFIQRRHANYDAGWFHTELCELIDKFIVDVEQGKEPRLIITCPPRAGKTTIVSENLPPFVLGRHPEWDLVLATYNQTLADTLGRKVRDILNDPSYQDLFNVTLDRNTNAADFVKTNKGGMFRATSVGGALTGQGAHVMVIDDPIKDRAEADSIIERERLWDWYTSVARTRMHPGGGIIIVHTRWSVDDLISRVLKHAQSNPDADQWQVYEFPAIAKVDEKYRKAGEALHPNRYPIEALLRIKATLPARDWEALYQASPYVETGGWFKRENFHWYDKLPDADMNWFLSGDYATSAKTTADHTAVGAWGVDSDGDLWLGDDVVYDRLSPLDSVLRTIRLGKNRKAHQLVTEKGIIANTIEPLFRLKMPEEKHFIIFEKYTRTGAKHIHAMAFRGLAEAGKVHLPASIRKWAEPLLLRFMPDVDGEDDFIDMCAGAGLMIQKAVIKPAPPIIPTLPKDVCAWQSNADYLRKELQEMKDGPRDDEDW